MYTQRPKVSASERANRPRTPADRSAAFAATQVRLKQEAAARRAVAQRVPVASGSTRAGRGHR